MGQKYNICGFEFEVTEFDSLVNYNSDLNSVVEDNFYYRKELTQLYYDKDGQSQFRDYHYPNPVKDFLVDEKGEKKVTLGLFEFPLNLHISQLAIEETMKALNFQMGNIAELLFLALDNPEIKNMSWGRILATGSKNSIEPAAGFEYLEPYDVPYIYPCEVSNFGVGTKTPTKDKGYYTSYDIGSNVPIAFLGCKL